MSKINNYKVGDKVRIIAVLRSGHGLQIGSIGVIEDLDESGALIKGLGVNGNAQYQSLYFDEFKKPYASLKDLIVDDENRGMLL
jgi:hypothetical protein